MRDLKNFFKNGFHKTPEMMYSRDVCSVFFHFPKHNIT